MANKPTADETPASTPSEAPVPTVATEPHTVVPAAKSSTKTRWVLTSIAGAGLLGIGLLGGILIGQHAGGFSAHDRGPTQISIEHQQSGKQDMLRERVRERLQDIRGGQQGSGRQGPGQQAPNQQTPDQPAPTTPPSGDNG